uniref:sodium/proline symporter PutP n=1 Tax=Proteinivorax hydrogeniformans TaxID=1826727 RepID=UPI003EBC9DCB
MVLWTFIIYLLGMLGIGIISYRLTSNLSDYVLGGRRLGPGVAALSAGASDMSSWLLMGLPGAVYISGGMNQIWIAIGLTVGAYLNWQFVAGRLRSYTEIANDSITIPDFLENRFKDDSRLLRVVSALVILVFFTFYTSSGMVGGATLFEASFGFSYMQALWIGGIIIIGYTFLGGFLAVSWTDFFQGLLMFTALVITPVVAITELGGWSSTVNTIGEIDPSYLDAFSGMSAVAIISLLAWGLGYFGQPHIITRFMAIRSVKDVPKARLIGMSWMVFAILGSVFTGFAGIAYFADAPLADGEQVFILFTQVLFNPLVSGVLLAAILAAIMSTVDSQLLVSSSAVAEDFYKAILKKDATQKELVWVSRIAVGTIALIALLLATNENSTILELVSYAWAGFGSAFGPVILLSLFWKRMNTWGALAGMVVGAVTVFAWGATGSELYEMIPGFILSSMAIFVVSSITPEPAKEIQAEFDKAKSI